MPASDDDEYVEYVSAALSCRTAGETTYGTTLDDSGTRAAGNSGTVPVRWHC